MSLRGARMLCGVRTTTVFLGALALVGCNRTTVQSTSVAQEASLAGSAASFPSAQPSATAAPDALVPQGPIGAAGGVFRGEGAQIIVPADALTAEVSFKITKVMARIAMTTHDVRVCRAP